MHELARTAEEMKAIQLSLTLRASRTRRYHTSDVVLTQTLAEHQWGVCMILRYLCCDAPSPALVSAALTHDLGEFCTGDLPAQFKWQLPEVAQAVEKADQTFKEKVLGIHTRLPEREQMILKCADMLELVWHCIQHLPNRDACEISERGTVYLSTEVMPNLPPHVRERANQFLQEMQYNV